MLHLIIFVVLPAKHDDPGVINDILRERRDSVGVERQRQKSNAHKPLVELLACYFEVLFVGNLLPHWQGIGEFVCRRRQPNRLSDLLVPKSIFLFCLSLSILP